MKTQLTTHLKLLTSDRPLLLLCVATLALALGYTIYMAFTIAPSEVQLATRYTAFGEVQFYRSQWFYLYNFAGFAILVALLHVGIMAKLVDRNMRSIALGLGWMTLIILLITIALTQSILDIAYLS